MEEGFLTSFFGKYWSSLTLVAQQILTVIVKRYETFRHNGRCLPYQHSGGSQVPGQLGLYRRLLQKKKKKKNMEHKPHHEFALSSLRTFPHIILIVLF
jgi:hypothetical protein